MNLKRLIKVKDSEGNFIGVQNFTYDELSTAFEELVMRVEADDDNDPDFSYCFHFILEGLGTVETDFTLDALADILSQAPKKIKTAYIDVYYSSPSTPDVIDLSDHGIVINNGRITGTY